jgi:putative glutamine amidotransferase
MSPEKQIKPLIGITCRWDPEKQRHYLESGYSEAIAAAGGVPVLIPLIAGAAAELTAHLDGIILSGSGSDVDPELYRQKRRPEVTQVHPERDETDFQVLEQAFREKKPVLGICYGMQSLNVYLGGSLVQHIPASVSSSIEHNAPEAHHEILLEPDSQLVTWMGGATKVQVNSTHHQSIDKPGLGLRVAALAPDGIIEAVEGGFPDHFVIAVQWHPERLWHTDRLSARLFTELVDAAAQRRQQRSKYFDINSKAIDFSRAGRTEEAISLIEEVLSDPSIAEDAGAVLALAGHAGVMCHYREDYRRGIHILQRAIALADTVDRPNLLYLLGKFYVCLNEPEKAKENFVRCYEACVSQNNRDYLELLERQAQYWK